MNINVLKVVVCFACGFLSACASTKGKSAISRQTSLRQSSVSGRFVVTAVSGQSVVYRPVGGSVPGNVRYVVVYRDGLQIPSVGTSIERSPENGFRIVGVTSALDGAETYNVIDLQGGMPSDGMSTGGRDVTQPIPKQRSSAAGVNDF
jgi:hypothetical protein